jgi:hypothetical protein
MENIIISDPASEAIKKYLYLVEKFKNYYFWNSPSSAKQRRNYERQNSFSYQDEIIKLHFTVECSCKNIYVTKSAIINGKKVTNITLKKLLNTKKP